MMRGETTEVWRTDTYWFDVAVAAMLLMLGHLYFGRFEEHKPRWRRLLKSLLGVGLVVGTSMVFDRTWTWVLIALMRTRGPHCGRACTSTWCMSTAT